MERTDIDALTADAAFMREKLRETREALGDQEVVMPYDNGGGQSGIRANPAFAEYEKLNAAYLRTLAAIEEAKPTKQAAASRLADLRVVAGKRAANG